MATSAEHPPAAPVSVTDARLGPLRDAILRPDILAVTTDVFDTVLWRRVHQPVDAFALVAQRLREQDALDPDISPAGFRELRVAAERAARETLAATTGQVEVRLEEIYALLPGWVFNHRLHPLEAMEFEVDLERDILVPDLDVVGLLEDAVARGKKLAAVSDTYFTGSQLRSLLRQPGLSELRFTEVLTSADHRRNKSGGLFEVALRELDVDPGAVVHVGDNHLADVEHPDRLGITTVHFPQLPPGLGEVLDAELGLLRRDLREPVTEQRRVAGERAAEITALRGKVGARTEGAMQPAALRPYWQFGATVYGPVFAGFAEWVCDRALALGATRVHGFMREGGFLGELVQQAADARGIELQAMPLWLNRAVLAVAAVGSLDDIEVMPLLRRRRTPTVRQFVELFGLSMADVPRMAGQADTCLDDPVVLTHLLDVLRGDAGLTARALSAAADLRERVVRSVQAEIGDDQLLVCVDLGWGGTAQDLLRRVLHHAGLLGKVSVAGLYMLNHEGVSKLVLAGMHVHGFLTQVGTPSDPTRAIVRSPEVLEQVCMPDHGSQIAIDDDGLPVLEAATRSAQQGAEAEAVRRGVFAFQREWLRYAAAMPQKVGSLVESRELLRTILLRSVISPTEQEAAQFSRWHHDENQGSDRSELIADPADTALLRYLDPGRIAELPMEDIYWPFALASSVDASWGQAVAAVAAGEVSADAMSGPVETGRVDIGVSDGTDVDPGMRIRVVPRRNRFGLSYVNGVLHAPAIREISISPCEFPAVIRIDFLELRCVMQGDEEPVVIRMDAPEHFTALGRINLFAIQPNVFVAHGSAPELRLSLTERLPRTVSRVHVSLGLATIAIGQLLPMNGRLRSVEEAGVIVEQLEERIRYMERSASWKLTGPLRLAKRKLGS